MYHHFWRCYLEVTVYDALKNSNAHIGEWVVIPEAAAASNMLGRWACVFSLSASILWTFLLGTVSTRTAPPSDTSEKKKSSLELGAEYFMDFKTTKDLVKDVKDATDGEGAHAAVITAASSVAFTQVVNYLHPGGTLVAVGMLGEGNIEATTFWTVSKRTVTNAFSIEHENSRPYVGNRQDAIEALALASLGKVKVH
ncbi:mannitol dehydrogenase [Hysterangium stoloniferum]|nr:mannitol dehydrogenase [Hysterangium stoloniferum]